MATVNVLLAEEEAKSLKEHVYSIICDEIQRARKDVSLDQDLLLTKQAVIEWLGCSASYFESLLAEGLPRGRKLSDRKQVFSKSEIRGWMLENEK